MRVPLAVFLLLLPGAAAPEPERHWFPEHCLAHVPDERLPRKGSDRDWNGAYRLAFRAIQEGDLAAAEREMCRALAAARPFGPRDWRFAETLDELGLIAFRFGELERAERLQGAAVAEMLLAVGPDGEPSEVTDALRPECRSGVPVYLERLGWVHEAIGEGRSVDDLRATPWLILREGYVPLDEDLAARLEWLISQYLLREDLAAAEALTALQRDIRGE